MGTLKIEKIGGLAGFGTSRSAIKSDGEQPISALSAADQATVEALFRNPKGQEVSGQIADGFQYRLTRNLNGKDQTVVVHEAAVPSALKACVTDKLK